LVEIRYPGSLLITPGRSSGRVASATRFGR